MILFIVGISMKILKCVVFKNVAPVRPENEVEGMYLHLENLKFLTFRHEAPWYENNVKFDPFLDG